MCFISAKSGKSDSPWISGIASCGVALLEIEFANALKPCRNRLPPSGRCVGLVVFTTFCAFATSS